MLSWLDAERRQLEQEEDTHRRHEARLDVPWRKNEQEQDTRRRQEVRSNVERRKAERTQRTTIREHKTGSYPQVLALFQACNKKGPTNVCRSCGGLFFKKSVDVRSKETLKTVGCTDEFFQSVLVLTPKETGKYVLCSTCYETFWCLVDLLDLLV